MPLSEVRQGTETRNGTAPRRARQTDTLAYVWLNYAMIRSMSRRGRFRHPRDTFSDLLHAQGARHTGH